MTLLSLLVIQMGWSQRQVQKWDLDSCINYAMKQNIQIKKSKIALEESREDTKTARAAMFPSLSFSSTHSLVTTPLNNTGEGNRSSYSGNYGFSSELTVYDGGKRTKAIEQSGIQNRIKELSISEAEKDIRISITQNYIQILYAYESVKTNQSTVDLSLAQLNRAKELLKAGSKSKSDVAQLESQYSTDKYQLVVAETTLKDYKLQLKQLLELDGNEEMDLLLPELQSNNVLLPLPDKMAVYSTALSIMPEIESSKLSTQAANMDVSIAKAGYMPTLSLSAGVGTSHTTGTNFTFGQQVKNGWNNSIGLSVNVPIFNNRKTKSAVQKAKLQVMDSELSELNEQKTLFKTIETIYLDAVSSQNRFKAATEKLQSTKTSYELINEQFNLGMKNTVELLTEKNNVLSAQQEVLQAKYMTILNIQLLKFYQGEQITLKN
ncbi:TolC family protein [uncultured Bacteroides sp.]|uniref:TolC family protein n=1 Tax=uncultured Bacteroides sp. TaxID=162156 RepID=UPI002AAC26FA|nr:TolC family protein [uncultured Bacteroides sp.]